MASIEKVAGGYRVRWHTPSGQSRSKTLPRKVDAEKFKTGVEHSKDVGAYIDPGRAKVKLGLSPGRAG
jgi:hypothetical protein